MQNSLFLYWYLLIVLFSIQTTVNLLLPHPVLKQSAWCVFLVPQMEVRMFSVTCYPSLLGEGNSPSYNHSRLAVDHVCKTQSVLFFDMWMVMDIDYPSDCCSFHNEIPELHFIFICSVQSEINFKGFRKSSWGIVLGQCKLMIISSILAPSFKTTIAQRGTDLHSRGRNPGEEDS